MIKTALKQIRKNQLVPFVIALISSIMLATSLARADISAISGVLEASGSVTQGGMITAKIPDGARASLDGTALLQSDNQHIAFGFHRDDIAPVSLLITWQDGTIHKTDITPQQRSYQTQSITGLASKYVTPPQSTLERITADRIAVSNARGSISFDDDFITNGFDWPARGTITGIYGSQRILNGKPRAPHYGIDIAAPKGTPVIAPADGIITMADDLYYTGGTIIIDHGLLISSTLLHLERMLVAKGDLVKRGMVIGTIGSTGRSTGAHLDWRINWGSKRLDPQLLVTKDPEN